MTPDTRKIARKELDAQLGQLRENAPPRRPPKGWIRAIRDSLGMTTVQFAARLGIKQPSVVELERREERGAVSLNALAEAARALNCTLVYALVPNESLDTMVKQQARTVAARRLGHVAHTMQLEAQGLPESHNQQQLEQLAEQILSSEPRALWS